MVNLKFWYINHNEEDHEYVVNPEKIELGRYSNHGARSEDGKSHWVLHAEVITRDGDERRDMGTRRRTFLLTEIRELEEVHDGV